MKWYYYVIGGIAVGLGIWLYLDDRKKINESAARARQAKADKRIFSNLNSNDDGTVRITETEVNLKGD